MPGATAGGLPYPLPTEPTRDGAANIKALADAIQARGGALKVQTENLLLTLDVNGRAGHLFPTPFSATPTVIFASQGAPGIMPIIANESYDQNGFTVVGLQVSTGGVTIRTGATWVYYIAVGPA